MQKAVCKYLQAAFAFDLFEKTFERKLNFSQQFFVREIFGVGMFATRTVSNHTTVDVIGQKFDAQSVQRRAHGGNLGKNIDAISVVLDHFLNAIDLAGDAIDARLGFAASGFVHKLKKLASV